MGRRAGPLRADPVVRSVCEWVRNVAHVVHAVRVLAIPARGEGDDRPDSADTEPRGQELTVRGGAVEVVVVPRGRHAAVAHLGCRAGGGRRGVPDEHAEAWCECGYVDGCVRRGDVVDGYATICRQSFACVLRYAFVRPVACPEIENCGPVVGEVLGECAAGAC